MKKKLTRTNNQSSLRLLAVILTLLTAHFSLLTSSCEQPFKAGLGPIIDLQDPTIGLDSPRVGTYIRRVKEFRGHAADDYKLDSVWFHLSNYPFEILPGFERLEDTLPNHPMNALGKFYKIVPDTLRTERNWTWKFKIDTMMLNEFGERVFPDGDLKIRLMAIDHVTKYVVTDELVFTIKNDIPTITVNAPPVQDGEADGYLGGMHLNYDFLVTKPTSFKRTVEPKADLQGTISDHEGIYRGRAMTAVIAEDGDPIFDENHEPILDAENKIKVDEKGNPKTPKLDASGSEVTVKLFPPQIRFWEVYFDTWPTDKNGYPVAEGTAYLAGVIPTLDQVPWRNLKDVGSVMDTGINNLTFFYTPPDASGHYYAFQIRAQSVDLVQSSAEYPRDYMPPLFEDAAPNDPFVLENSYVLVLVSESQERPVLSLYELEDIWGPPRDGKPVRVGDRMDYNRLLEITDQMETDGNHIYIDKPNVIKNGAFTLRMKASHSGGIASAKVYWEKSGGSEKGRFIWDPIPADGPYDGWRGAIPSRSAHYSTWGLNEPDGGSSVRSFVFTYSDKNPVGATPASAVYDRLPNTTEFMNNVMGNIGGISKIQRYTGEKANSDGKDYDYDELPEDAVNWQDVYKLDEGKYKFYVYAKSNSGASCYKPFEVNLSIDRRKPSIDLNKIDGSAFEKKNAAGERENTVNGVIQPRFLFKESQSTDSLFRKGTTAYFERPDLPGNYYFEQAYILIPEAQRSVMDDYLADNPWPEFPNLPGYTAKPVIPGVTVSKHGPIDSDSSCRFRTSSIYHVPPPPLPLPSPNPEDAVGEVLDDGAYRLYVFARDNAFNVGSASFPIIVDKKTDYPTFDFSIGTIKPSVTEPDSAYDVGGSKYAAAKPYEKSFITATGNRSEFNASSTIQVRIKDDDSLDLGVEGGDPSGIVVTFIGSHPDLANDLVIVADDDTTHLMTLGDADVKAAFAPQTVDGGKRLPVTDRTGKITYDMLLKLLKNNSAYNDRFPTDPTAKAAVSTIPDGVYRVGISICDYSPAKLKMEPPFAPTADPAAYVATVKNMPVPDPVPAPDPPLPADDVRRTTEYFWIFVDTRYPDIIIDDSDPTPLQPGSPKALEGTVSDENGPITLVSWKVKNGNATVSEMGKTVTSGTPKIDNSSGVTLNDPKPSASPAFVGGKWVYPFSYRMNLNGAVSGTYDFELTFQDRFGKKTTKLIRNSIDNIPPVLGLVKRIETFKRDFDDVILKGVQKSDPGINKQRLSVKVVNFTIKPDDSEKIRWWLLPADTGSDESGFITAGSNVGRLLSKDTSGRDTKGFDAYPAKQVNPFDTPGVYYGNNSNPTGFNRGVYGVVDVAKEKFTIAFDSRKLKSLDGLSDGDGEYRLYIVGRDKTGNYSEYLDTSIDIPQVFQVVFFLQKEDEPYLDKNISPGEAITSLGWPQENNADKEMPVLIGPPTIRGTIWENNGFFEDSAEKDFWPKTGTVNSIGSVTIWFSGTGATLTSGWEDLVKAGGDISGYVKKNIPFDNKALSINSSEMLGMQLRNISLTIGLKTLYPEATYPDLWKDGKKRYIIKATDSPVYKLKEDTYPGSFVSEGGTYTVEDGNGIPMGANRTSSTEDEGIRENNFRQYAFVYDATPPKVVIDSPVKKPVPTYGKNFAVYDPDNPGFILGGYISDVNLQKTAGGDYYFDYYLNTDDRKTFALKAMTGVSLTAPIEVNVDGAPLAGSLPAPPADTAITSGQHIYAITRDPAGKITVYFRIKISDFSNNNPANNPAGIIPLSTFTGLPDGQHTLTLWATDKSGKEGVDWVDFIKDVDPPKITFTNLTGDNRPYDTNNKSKVEKALWWTTGYAATKQTLLFGTSTVPPLPLTTIYYDSGKPELRGTINDVVSNIALTTGSNAAVGTGDINISDSAFKYWIDGETSPRYYAVIDGKDTKSVRWTINLTRDGTTAAADPPLSDGVHTIVLTAADKAGLEIPDAERYMIAFRLDSKPPRSAVSVSGINTTNKDIVYGNTAYQNTPMFTLDVIGGDANLEKVELNIKNTTNTAQLPTNVTFTARDSATWTYYPKGISTTITVPSSLKDKFAPQNGTTETGAGTGIWTGTPTEDYIQYSGTYGVPKTMFTDSGKYEVTVVAYDTFGNNSEEFLFQFTYDKDSPEIEFTNPSDDNKNASATLRPQDFIVIVNGVAQTPEGILTPNPNNKINRLTSENLRIQGNVKDKFSAIRQVQSRVERWNWATAAWVQVEGWRNIRNYSDNTQTQVSWTKNLLGQNKTSVPAPDTADVDLDLRTVDQTNPTGEGLYRIQIRAKDASVIARPLVPPGNEGWESPSGEGNPVVSQYEYFYFDRTNPTLEITSINGSTTAMETYYTKPPTGGFSFEGTVTDKNRFAKVEVKFETTKDTTVTTYPMTVTISKLADADPATSFNQGAEKQKWRAVFTNTSTNLTDGKYKVTVTVYDMTGRSTSETKSFILDSTPPTVRFTLPAKVLNSGYGDDAENKKPTPAATANGFASVIVPGGPTSVITGETGDKPGVDGDPSTVSGVDQMWFHLGFIEGTTYNTANPFPSKDAIKTWEDTLIQRHNPALTSAQITALTVKQRNTYMDTIAEYRASDNNDDKGNAWFKLGGSRKPTGFVINNPNIYDWRFEIPDKTDATPIPTTDPNYQDHYATTVDGKRLSEGNVQIEGLKLYCGTITVKGKTYTVGDTAARQMVRQVTGQAGGIYRLPLWIRLTDIAGNVEYYCHDIWIDANGPIPSTSIESPDNGTQYNARGGTISVDGVARSNTSVYGVIFRVFADGEPNTNLDGIQTDGRPTNTYKTITTPTNNGTNGMPAVANIVKINGYDNADPAMVNKLPAAYQPAAGDAWTWQSANLTLKGGSGEPVIPWSIMLNSEDQIRNLIGSQGFSSSGGTTKDMIRVWLEVFVFNGEGSPIRSSIYPNDTKGTASYQYTGNNGGYLYGTADGTPGPKPYVRAFYIRTGAAAITYPNVGTWDVGSNTTPFTSPFRRGNFMWNAEEAGNQGGGGYKGAGTETRSKRFAFSATLDPNPSGTSGSGLGEVAYRIKLDGGSYGTWTTVWKSGDAAYPTTPQSVNSNGVRISVRDTTGSRIRYYFDYAIDSKVTANTTDNGTTFAPVNNGNWTYSGGTVTVQIRMKDNSPQPNEAEQTIQVGVDNFTPLADTAYAPNKKVAGTNVNFIGRVYDYATAPAADAMNTEYTPRKLERVSVWFTKGNGTTAPFVNLNVKNTTSATLTGMRSIAATTANSRTSTIVGGGTSDAVSSITVTNRGTAANISYPGLGTLQAHNADYVRDITQSSGQPVNKMLWAPVNSAVYDVRWSLTLDSTLLPDGELTLHYIVVDSAGNASYYTQTGISVRNNYPAITKVTLYTNNDGQGAQYTMDATSEYSLNDYTGKMFANPATADYEKINTTGYLNSGFISKNRYIGFKIETDGGNRPLNFRLQHVKRQKLKLSDPSPTDSTKTVLAQMVADRAAASPTTINLYTIAWYGDYSNAKWRALGVPIDNPPLGTHFVFNPSDDFTKDASNNYSSYLGTAEVWKYTAVLSRSDITNYTGAGQAAGSTATVAYGPTDDFRFFDTAHFDPTAAGMINEFDGSHPTEGDTKADNPADTGFFLIRVWDSINTNYTGEQHVNDQLYDALVVGMNVYQTDKNKPVARLYDLNPYTESAVVEGNKNQTIKNAAEPLAIGSNIVRGGLYNDGTSRAMVRSGFIDPRSTSTALSPNNGVYFRDVGLAADKPSQLINGLTLPAYDLKVGTDTVAAGSTRDQVSGKIILRGHAWDDQLIDEITLTLPNAPTTRTILKLTNGKMAATTGYTDTAFVVEDLHWKTGHSVEWAYVWDTGDSPASPATISVTVKEKNGAKTSDSIASDNSAPLTAAFHNSVSVDIVPYITGFERQTPQFTTKRSLQGWYSFYQGETGIKVNGYNFGTGAIGVTINGTAVGTTTNAPVDNGKTQYNQRSFGITTANVSSGPIIVTFGGATQAYNNNSTTNPSPTTTKSWNREYNAYTPGSDLWINKHYAHIWRSVQAEGTGAPGATGGTAGTIFAQDQTSSGLDSPGMSLQYTGNGAGRLHGSWTVYGRESLFYAQNTGVKPTMTANATTTNSTAGESSFGRPGALLLSKAGEPYSDGDIDYYNGAGGDNYTNNTSVVAAFQRDGEPWLILKPRLSSIVFNNAGTQDGGGHDYGYYISRQNGPVSTYRWKNTRIRKADVSTGDASPGKVFVTAYDSTYKRLFFKTVTGNLAANNSGNQITNDANGGATIYLDGGSSTTIGNSLAASTGAGNWSAVDFTSDGRPIVAYFDEEHQTLRIAYGNSTAAGGPAATDWTRRYVLPESNPLYRGSGSYVSMKIDRRAGADQNRIHLAFYNSTYKAVVYATGTMSATAFTLTSASVIDRVVEGGQWTDISVDNSGNPWIVYADSARLGNRDGARIAYKTSGNGAFTRPLTDTITNTTITGWEALTMPANYQVNNDRLNIAAWPPTGYTGGDANCPIGGWNAAVGYASDQFRIGYFFKPTAPNGF